MLQKSYKGTDEQQAARAVYDELVRGLKKQDISVKYVQDMVSAPRIETYRSEAAYAALKTEEIRRKYWKATRAPVLSVNRPENGDRLKMWAVQQEAYSQKYIFQVRNIWVMIEYTYDGAARVKFETYSRELYAYGWTHLTNHDGLYSLLQWAKKQICRYRLHLLD